MRLLVYDGPTVWILEEPLINMEKIELKRGKRFKGLSTIQENVLHMIGHRSSPPVSLFDKKCTERRSLKAHHTRSQHPMWFFTLKSVLFNMRNMC
ncbi:hypothetical protein GDO86_018090 [Hymenochirus boettgeri]|uniref:Uncharacterized protein n=1 Tax=Hymenochirus boettgeri TaxID=247094 RepID=A0A8T2IN81_9PIPI|nr:hypothetical protein GDO86_018090 [Hymenochirus boettgeri]